MPRRVWRVLRQPIWVSYPVMRAYRSLYSRGWRPIPAAAEIDCWVCGSPRSGNTFTGILLEEALGLRHVEYHRHYPSELFRLLELGRPGVLVVREPREAAASWAVFTRKPVANCLEDYIDYHRHVRRVASQLVILPFPVIAQSAQSVVDLAARRFGLPIRHAVGEELLARVNARIDRSWTDPASGTVIAHKVARPNESRERLKHQVQAELAASPACLRLLQEAEAQYHDFLNLAAAVRP